MKKQGNRHGAELVGETIVVFSICQSEEDHGMNEYLVIQANETVANST